jgi:hypothetical protein
MRKLLNNPWVVGALALAAVLFVGGSLYQQLHPTVSYAAPPATGPAVEPALADASAPAGEPEPARPRSLRAALLALVFPENLPDPFAPRAGELRSPAGTPQAEAPDVVESVQLSGIWRQDGTELFVLGGKICRIGDRIGRITIDAAGLHGVWLSHWRGRDYLEVGKVFTLVTPARAAAATPETPPHEG